MSSYEKIVAPRIVQPSVWRYVLPMVSCLLITAAAAWFAYDAGRTSAGAAALDACRAQSAGLRERVVQVEAERDDLRVRLVDLREGLAPEPEVGDRSMEPPDETTDEPVDGPIASSSDTVEATGDAREGQSASAREPELSLEDVRLAASEPEGDHQLSFRVAKNLDDDEQVTGSIWIAVNGEADGEAKRLPFKELSAERANFVAMRFKREQLVNSVLTLPVGFSARNLVIEVNPAGDKYKPVSASIGWRSNN